MKNKEFTIKNQKYKLKETSEKKGGNGTVYTLHSNETNDKYVVKYFSPENFSNKDKRSIKQYNFKINERYERFKKEITFLRENSFKGTVPLILSKVPNKYYDNTEAYYIMPKGKPLKIYNNEILPSFKDILYLANNLKVIHEAGFAHRDIKPENIIYLEGKPCFCDFGLVWKCNDERITLSNEKIGPYKIMPPELMKVDPNNNDIDFRKSDLYLLAKVLWMMIKKDNDGFNGPYNRCSPNIYVDLYEKGKVQCFEYFHELMEKSTIYEVESRITDDEFICLLKKQIDILEGKSTENLEKLNYLTKTKKIYYSETESSKVFEDVQIIVDYIREIMSVSLFEIDNKKNSVNIEILDCKNYDNEIVIDVKYRNMIKHIHFYPKSLIVTKTWNIVINIALNIDIADKYNKFLNNDDNDMDVFIDDNFKIRSI